MRRNKFWLPVSVGRKTVLGLDVKVVVPPCD